MWEEVTLRADMVGRDEEFNSLREQLKEAKDGKGCVVFLAGEAGVGKTRLVLELMNTPDAKEMRIASARCQETERPFTPWISVLSKIGLEYLLCAEPVKVVYASIFDHEKGMMLMDAKNLDSDMDGDILNSMITAVQNFVKDSLEQFGMEIEGRALNLMQYGDYSIILERGIMASVAAVIEGKVNTFLIKDLKEVIDDLHENEKDAIQNWGGVVNKVEHLSSYLEPILMKHRGTADPSKIKDNREILFDNVSVILRERAEQEPLMIFLDDLQWTDNSTKYLLHHIARDISQSPMLIVVTYRPEESENMKDTIEKMRREKLFVELELKRLDKTDVHKMIRSIYTATPDEFVDIIYNKTDGNPFFIEEILRTLEFEGKIKASVPSTLKDIEHSMTNAIPATIEEVITRRLRFIEQKNPNLYKTLEWISIAGEVDYNLIL